MRVDSGPDLPDAAGVRARLLHSCVVVVPSRRDFTFSTAKFGLSTSWNVFIAAGPPVSSPSSPNVDPRVRIPIPAFPLRRGSLPSLLDHDTQATWAPRPISIRFSTSDSRLFQPLLYPSSRTSILFRPSSTPSTRSTPGRQVCLLFRRRKSHRTFDPGPVAATAQLAQYTAAQERHHDGSVIRPSRVPLLGC